MRKRLKTMLFKVVVVVFFIALFEGACTAYAWLRYGTASVANLNESDTGNSYITELDSKDQPWLDTLYPTRISRSYGTRTPRSAGERLNNVGLIGVDFPLEKDASKFTVLACGGSVCDQMLQEGHLEKLLNERYEFGKPVVVLNAASGSWSQPIQSIIAMLYGDIADAVITLDGFNEHHSLVGGNERLEYPVGPSFWHVNPAAKGGFDQLARAWQSNRLKRFSLEHNSRALYFGTRLLRSGLASESEGPRAANTELETIFGLPADWSQQRRTEFNMRQYEKYMRSVHVLAAQHRLREAHFVQPAAIIGKKLTPEERRRVKSSDFSAEYRWMTGELLKLNRDRVPVVSLLDCFDATAETVYADGCHPRLGPGYRIMSERIAAELAKLWQIGKNPPTTKAP